jgi:hypothetical protein
MKLLEVWGYVLNESLINMWFGFINFIPVLLGAIIIFLVGWLIGKLVGKAIAHLFEAAKINKLFESAGFDRFSEKFGMKFSVGTLFGVIVKWFIILVFLITSLEIIGLTQVNDFLRQTVLYYLPKVVIAALVLIIASVIAEVMKKLINASAKAASLKTANMLGSIALYAIWIFAFIIALSELGIASAFMQILFTGFIAALAIALGLAFGLGGRDAASRAIDRISDDMKSR